MRLLTLLLLPWNTSANLGLRTTEDLLASADVELQPTQRLATAKPLRALAQILQNFNPAGGWQAHGLISQVAHSPALLAGGLPPQVSSRRADMLMQISLDDPRLVTVELPRPTGIDFSCDHSQSWTYVSGLDPMGAAARLGLVRPGDQLVAIEGTSVVGMNIGTCMEAMGSIPVGTVELSFFRGTKEELQKALGHEGGHPETVTVTIKQIGKPDQELKIPYGANLRDELVARRINVYQSIAQVTNCQGKQRCGTCIVNVLKGMGNLSARTGDEASTLQNSEHPATYKISCRTEVYGDITIQIMPKIKFTQIVAR